jgi:hypothetical protein
MDFGHLPSNFITVIVGTVKDGMEQWSLRSVVALQNSNYTVTLSILGLLSQFSLVLSYMLTYSATEEIPK